MANEIKEEQYVNGSDMLICVGEEAVGHCTSHTLTYNTETKDRAVKPPKSQTSKSASLYKQKGITGITISISFDGLVVYNEAEYGINKLRQLVASGKPVTVKAIERGNDANPYLVGSFVLTSLEESHPANDDSTYKGQLENNGAPEVFAPSTETEGNA